MGRTLAAAVIAASLLAIGCSEASAWVCFATGLGSGGAGRVIRSWTPSFRRSAMRNAMVLDLLNLVASPW